MNSSLAMGILSFEQGRISRICFNIVIIRNRDAFDDTFLLATSDHVIDPHLIYDLANYDLGGAEGCILVEDNIQDVEIDLLPPTAVYVLEKDKRVKKVGRQLKKYNAVEAGMFLLKPSIFKILGKQARTNSYITLAAALDVIAKGRMLKVRTSSLETSYLV